MKLPKFVYTDLLAAGYKKEQIEEMSRDSIIDSWLIYTGIIEFTRAIIELTDIKEDKDGTKR